MFHLVRETTEKINYFRLIRCVRTLKVIGGQLWRFAFLAVSRQFSRFGTWKYVCLRIPVALVELLVK